MSIVSAAVTLYSKWELQMTIDSAVDAHILSIIQTHEILEQSDLQARLKDRGFGIPQATLSRRLKKLKIAKISGVYKVIDLNQPNLPFVLNMQVSEFGLIVLHTHPGNANGLAYYIDQKHITYSSKNSEGSGILGTIAGDDTVLLIIKSKESLVNVLSIIHKEFPYLTAP